MFLSFLSTLVLYVIIPYTGLRFVSWYFYRHDTNKNKKSRLSINVFGVLALIDVIAIYILNGQYTEILHIGIAVALSLLAYNVFTFVLIKKYGRDKPVVSKVENELKLRELKEKLVSKGIDFETYEKKTVELEGGYVYYLKPKEFFHEKTVKVSNKLTNLIDVLFISVIGIALVSYSVPIIMDFFEMKTASAGFYGVMAFIGAYVLSPFFPDLYYSVLLFRNPNIDFGSYIGIDHGGKYIFGKVEDMNFFAIVIFQSREFIKRTIPHKFLSDKVIDSYDSKEGRLFNYNYVLDSVSADKFLDLVKEFLKDFAEKNPSSLLENKIDVRKLDAQFGYSIDFMVYVKKLENYDQICRDIRAGLVEVAEKNGISLPTPDMISIQR